MKKKILALALVLVLSLAVFAPSIASACGYVDPQTAKYNKAVAIVNAANAQIRALVYAAQKTPYDDVAILVVSTNAVAASAKYAVSQLGYKVGCTYTYYQVDGQTVAIDPLYVINPRPGSGGGSNNDNAAA